MYLLLALALLLGNGSALQLDTFNKYLAKDTESTDQCLAQKDAFLTGLQSYEDWALRNKFDRSPSLSKPKPKTKS